MVVVLFVKSNTIPSYANTHKQNMMHWHLHIFDWPYAEHHNKMKTNMKTADFERFSLTKNTSLTGKTKDFSFPWWDCGCDYEVAKRNAALKLIKKLQWYCLSTIKTTITISILLGIEWIIALINHHIDSTHQHKQQFWHLTN